VGVEENRSMKLHEVSSKVATKRECKYLGGIIVFLRKVRKKPCKAQMALQGFLLF
jgi:hypothetical protein